MKKTILCCLISFILFSWLFSDDFLPNTLTVCFSVDLVGNTRGEFIISFEEGIVVTPFDWLNELAIEYGIINLQRKVTVKNQEWNLNGKYPMNVFRMEIEDHRKADELLSILSTINYVMFAEYEAVYEHFHIPNDSLIDQQWHLSKIQAFEAWDIQTGCPTIVTGIVDSGIKWNHPDLAGNIWIIDDELPGITIDWDTGEIIGGDGIDNDGNGFIDDVMGWDFRSYQIGGLEDNNPYQDFHDGVYGNYHGTRVAGIIASVGDNGIGVAGIAYNTKILSSKHSSSNTGSSGNTNPIGGIYYHVDSGARVINCSFGGANDNPDMRMAVSYAIDHDVLIVASAGNSGRNLESFPIYPAMYDGVLTVAATDIDDLKSIWNGGMSSNYGKRIDVSAPGTDVLTTSFGFQGSNIYENFDGTSASAPIVSGIAALLLSEYQNLTNTELIYHIKKGVDSINHINPAFSDSLGSGRVNALNSLLSVRGKFQRYTEDHTIGSGTPLSYILGKVLVESSTLTIVNALVKPFTQVEYSRFYGFELLRSSSLVLVNTIMYLEDGFIKLDAGSSLILDANSKIYISGGSITIEGPATIKMFNGAEMIFTDNSSLLVKSDASLTLNNVSMSFEDSEIETGSRSELIMDTTSQITLSGGSLQVRRPSQLTMLNGSELVVTDECYVNIGAYSTMSLSESSFSLIDSGMHVGNQGVLSIDEESIVNISESNVSINGNGSIFILNSSEMTLIDDSLLSFAGVSSLNLEESSLLSTDSVISLKDFASITLENSQWIAENTNIMDLVIDGTILPPDFSEIPYQNINQGNPDLDKGGIFINASYIDFEDVNISMMATNRPFYGIFFNESKPDPADPLLVSRIKGNISRIAFLSLYDSQLLIEESTISQSGRILVSQNSILEIEGSTITESLQILAIGNSLVSMSESAYFENLGGIHISKGIVHIIDSELIENGATALIIGSSFSNGPIDMGPIIPQNIITNSLFSDNLGPAVELWGGLLDITDSNLVSNTDFGFLSHSIVSPKIIGKTKIQNTVGLSEISGRGVAFPQFQLCETDGTKPLVGVIGGNANLDTDYLLMAMGDFTDVILAYNLDIDRTDLDDLLYPYWRDFEFDYDEFDDLEDLFLSAEMDLDNEDFMDAYYKLMYLITYYPDNRYAIPSIPLLPFVYIGLDWDLRDLITYLEGIDHPNLIQIARETIVHIYELLEDYLMMIYLLDILINDPDTGAYEKLVYMALQMHAHYQATLLGLRSFESLSVYQPSSIGEYQEMLSGISESIMNLLKGHEVENPDVEILPSVTTLYTNYPNPFNPITTISFDLAVDSIVSIDIYNIRGQRVKTITNEHFTAGSHRVEWNGTDENGREVSSGVFFYRMQAEGFTQVRRMVLLK